MREGKISVLCGESHERKKVITRLKQRGLLCKRIESRKTYINGRTGHGWSVNTSLGNVYFLGSVFPSGLLLCVEASFMG